MGFSRAAVAFALSAALLVQPATAEISKRAQEAYDGGRFVLAATLSEAEGSPEALVFAARARIVDAVTREGTFCLDCLVRAEEDAQTAIKQDANFAEAYVQYALALGFQGRLVSVEEARSKSMAEKGRAAIDKAIELDPTNVWARAALGAWHLEIVKRAGPVLAAILYGAREDDGLKSFRTALEGAPETLLLHYHFALTILALDPKRFRAEAIKSLEEGDKDKDTTAVTRLMRERADKLRALLNTGSDDEIAALVRRYQGYPPESGN